MDATKRPGPAAPVPLTDAEAERIAGAGWSDNAPLQLHNDCIYYPGCNCKGVCDRRHGKMMPGRN